jgi:hypothetical protein
LVVKKKTKKVLLGFVTTSFILLVMVAPTTAIASLQQEDNVTATDEPNILTGPEEVDKLPILEEPIPPENENNDTDDDGNDGGGSGRGAGDGNVTRACQAILKGIFETDKKMYKQGEDVIVSGYTTAGGRIWSNDGTPVEVVYSSPSGEHYRSGDIQPEYGDCSFSFSFTIKNVTELGTWRVSAVYPQLREKSLEGRSLK